MIFDIFITHFNLRNEKISVIIMVSHIRPGRINVCFLLIYDDTPTALGDN